ncbi:exodeoxyribonuclease VII small subunit [Streptobacillus felis]|uniref:Exodeoxyribonuclease 7 small subunit n=1 Tax=Streptobacillus felis TaxID=1384509 RepID=A0A7Z0TCA7_9FUSO|nr:exodeoxyribonuclease VII small subunit [Streptobacillus felis]NYV28223.1 exodeoxyribonuclease VII small subunit [Streptobacillus felis]
MAKKNFEQILDEIKDSISKLESFDITLEESISEYENAVKLIKEAEKKLREVEGKLEVIKINVEKE